MARITLGIGTSHTPQMSSPPEIWSQYGERDKTNKRLLGTDGRLHEYAELAETCAPVDPVELSPSAWAAKHGRANRALDELGAALTKAAPDAIVIIGDDQDELFRDDGIPSFAVYWGEDVTNIPPTPAELARVPADVQTGLWSYHGESAETYPVHSALAHHMIEQLVASEFDVTQVRRQAEGRTLGHAFTFVQRRLVHDRTVPIVPVAVNAYYAPNQPTASRCLAFGRALRSAIESWDQDADVAVVASGGLSHFVVDEALDHAVLDAFASRSFDRIREIPQSALRSGTSEIRNWIAASGALEHLDMQLVDYVAAFRSPAGTGVGMAFATWS